MQWGCKRYHPFMPDFVLQKKTCVGADQARPCSMTCQTEKRRNLKATPSLENISMLFYKRRPNKRFLSFFLFVRKEEETQPRFLPYFSFLSFFFRLFSNRIFQVPTHILKPQSLVFLYGMFLNKRFFCIIINNSTNNDKNKLQIVVELK